MPISLGDCVESKDRSAGSSRCWPTSATARDIVTQMSAASNALDQALFLLVASGLTWCVGHPGEAVAEGYSINDVQKLFMKLA